MRRQVDFEMQAYQSGVVLLAVTLFLSELDNYLFGLLQSVPPLMWIGVVGVLAAPVLYRYAAPTGTQFSGCWWFGLFYALASILGLLFSSHSPIADQAFRTAILSAMFLFLMATVFSSSRSVALGKKTVLALVIAGAAINVWEYFLPGAFSVVPGRAAGLHQNPNRSAAALVLGMALTMDVTGPKWREAFALFVGVAVLATFSRAGTLAWLLAVILLAGLSLLSVRRLGAATGVIFAGLAALPFLSTAWFPDALAAQLDLALNMLSRLNPLSAESYDDFSAQERRRFAAAAWELFADHPVLGAGIGSTQEQTGGQGTHNMYLTLMAEHGMVGMLVMPLLTMTLFFGAKGSARNTSIIVGTLTLFFAFFDHNLLDNRSILLLLALQCSAGAYGAANRSNRADLVPCSGHRCANSRRTSSPIP
jgi:O-antigen ligase